MALFRIEQFNPATKTTGVVFRSVSGISTVKELTSIADSYQAGGWRVELDPTAWTVVATLPSNEAVVSKFSIHRQD